MYTVNQIADMLQISRQCVYALIDSGKLICHRFGNGRGTLRISKDDLEDYLSRCRSAVNSPAAPAKLRHLHLS